MTEAGRRTRRARIVGAAGALLVVAGIMALTVGIRAQRSAPQPPRSAARPVQVVPSPSRDSTAPTRDGTGQHGPVGRGPVLPRSRPLRLAVPAIGVDTELRAIGLTTAGRIRTPPLTHDAHAYWLTVSPTPGQLGPATIIGHVDSARYGPAVFFRLGALRPRDHIKVTRADGTTAVFEVQRVAEYPKAQFPTRAVYGNTDHAALRLITCGGLFDPATHNYESNIVAYASLVNTYKS
jgi:hypothetical protein